MLDSIFNVRTVLWYLIPFKDNHQLIASHMTHYVNMMRHLFSVSSNQWIGSGYHNNCQYDFLLLLPYLQQFTCLYQWVIQGTLQIGCASLPLIAVIRAMRVAQRSPSRRWAQRRPSYNMPYNCSVYRHLQDLLTKVRRRTSSRDIVRTI